MKNQPLFGEEEDIKPRESNVARIAKETVELMVAHGADRIDALKRFYEAIRHLESKKTNFSGQMKDPYIEEKGYNKFVVLEDPNSEVMITLRIFPK